MEIGDIINTSGIGMIVQENENEDLLIEMDGKNLHDDDTVYIMENAYEENDDDENHEYIVEEDEEMEQPEEEMEDLYNCNVCGMNFTSIDDHIQNYHSNQDVILDVADTNEQLTTRHAVKCEPPEYINDIDEDDETSTIDDGDADQIVFVNVDVDGATTVDRATKNAKNTNTQQKETYVCNRCNQTYDTLRSLSSHILNAHNAKSQTPRNTSASKQVVRKVVRKTKENATKEKNSEESESDANERFAERHTCEQCNTVFQSAKSLK